MQVNDKKKRVIFCGTHPVQFNGYSKVVYELCKNLLSYSDIELFIFGFQNFYKSENHFKERQLLNCEEIFDAYANEEPKKKGFGENLIKDYVLKVKPDIVIIYNDLVVISSLLNKLNEIKDRDFKIVPYIDIVYKNEKNHMIKYINDNVDGAIMFTNHWKESILQQGFSKPLSVMPHGFNKDMFYPIPRKIARKFVGIDEDAFVIVNLNRNQPRKRWDICIMAYIKFICKHMDDNIKLMIATNTTGGWDIFDIMISECRKYDITFQDLKKHLIILQNPQQITDKEINIMYNVGDIGINTCDGEGFGLCNFEQAGVGIPQIVPKIGGFVDYLDASRSILINPKWTYYCDHSRDFVSGEAEVCDINDIVNALEYYYTNKKVRNEHGNLSREYILQNYKWQDIGKVFYDVIQDFTHDVKISSSSDTSITSITETEDIDIDALINAYNKDDNIVDTTIMNEKTSKDTFGDADALINAYNKDDTIVDTTIINEKTSKDTINADSDDDSDDELIIIEGGG
uniref:Glycosyl transferase family 1 domain-containing protein n=1 Tax=viral metagenome TaxID=1070528 RepID=A0A6C0BRW8_9ZZZZ